MATSDAKKLGLCLPILFRDVAATRTSLAGVVCRNRQQDGASPSHLVLQLPPELAPALVEDGFVQTRLLLDPLAVLFAVAFGRPGHIPNLQILNTNERVVLADRCGVLCKKSFRALAIWL